MLPPPLPLLPPHYFAISILFTDYDYLDLFFFFAPYFRLFSSSRFSPIFAFDIYVISLLTLFAAAYAFRFLMPFALLLSIFAAAFAMPPLSMLLPMPTYF